MSDVIGKVMSLFSGDGEGGSDKDLLIRQLIKEISQNKYAKFYRSRQAEADTSLGQYFYSVYKTVYPLQVFLKDAENEIKIKQITLESFLDKHTMDLIKNLSPEGIAERKKSAGADIVKQLQEDLAALAAGFDSPKISAADRCYNLIASMKQFVFFDYCSMLKKFDPEIREGDFNIPPKLAPVDIGILVSDIANFLSVFPSCEDDDDWKTVFEILKYCKGGTDVIPPANWNGLLTSLKDLRESKILDIIGRIATGNPILEIKPTIPYENLSATWLESKTRDVRNVIAGIAGSQRDAQIHALEQVVFGPLTTKRLTYYTSEKGKVLVDKGLEEFVFAPSVNHLMAFIQEFYSKEIQELCDILLIRGKWSKVPASRQMSEAFHSVFDSIERINKLDNSLAEDGTEGPRLRGALLRVDRDKSQVRYISSIVQGINMEAEELIKEAMPSIIVVGKHFKMLMEDFDKKPQEYIVNWKELASVSRVPLNQRITEAYKKINYFVQLMTLGTQPIVGA
ncbi:MAG: DUF5312 family protein [Treponema sp.]|nr:DUF5312 family protein [Treponema sp.]